MEQKPAAQAVHQALIATSTDQPAPAAPTLKAQALAKGWSEQDADWLEKGVAGPFQSIALSHGRMCFSLVMQCGALSASFGQIAAQQRAMGSGVQRIVGTALQVAQNISNDLVTRILADQKITQEQFGACRKEIEMVGALSMSAPGQGRIILPN